MKRVLLLLAAMSLSAFADDSKISPDLKGKGGDAVEVIVQFTTTPTDKHKAKIANHGGEVKSVLHSVKAFAASVPTAKLAALSDDPEVRYISPNRQLKPHLDNTVAAVNAQIAWNYGLDGSGIGVVVIDSGVTNRTDFNSAGSSASRVVYNENFVQSSNTASDQFGHGTHVAGIIAGNGNQSTGANYTKTFKGLAPNANIINLRVLDGNGKGYDSDVITAIQRAISLKSTYNIRVINLSLGRPIWESYQLDPVCQAAEAAWKAGIVVVVSAGNSGRDNSQGTNGYGTITAPGNDPYVITVGAMKTMVTPDRSDDQIASYSSKGPTQIDHIVKPDLLAPGNMIASTEAGRKVCREEILSLSIGMCFYPQDGKDAEHLLTEADKKMYVVKQAHHEATAGPVVVSREGGPRAEKPISQSLST